MKPASSSSLKSAGRKSPSLRFGKSSSARRAASACTGPSHARKSLVFVQQWTMPAPSLLSSSTAAESRGGRLRPCQAAEADSADDTAERGAATPCRAVTGAEIFGKGQFFVAGTPWTCGHGGFAGGDNPPRIRVLLGRTKFI
jgi:hypothetical protein